jgi:hypothetical protein
MSEGEGRGRPRGLLGGKYNSHPVSFKGNVRPLQGACGALQVPTSKGGGPSLSGGGGRVAVTVACQLGPYCESTRPSPGGPLVIRREARGARADMHAPHGQICGSVLARPGGYPIAEAQDTTATTRNGQSHHRRAVTVGSLTRRCPASGVYSDSESKVATLSPTLIPATGSLSLVQALADT